jgi:hypothetical protein
MRVQYDKKFARQIRSRLVALMGYTKWQREFSYKSSDGRLLYSCKEVISYGNGIWLNIKVSIWDSITKSKYKLTFIYNVPRNFVQCDSPIFQEYQREIWNDFLNIFIVRTIKYSKNIRRTCLDKIIQYEKFVNIVPRNLGFYQVKHSKFKTKDFFYVTRFFGNEVIVAFPKPRTNQNFVLAIINLLLGYCMKAGELSELERSSL